MSNREPEELSGLEKLLIKTNNLKPGNYKNLWSGQRLTNKMSFRESYKKALIEFAVNIAPSSQAQSFKQKLKDIERRFAKISVTVLLIELFKDAEIVPGVS